MTFRIFSRWPPYAIFNFEKFEFWKNFRRRSQNLSRHTKFGQNWMIGGRDIAIKPKSNMAAAAMLNLLPVYILIFSRLWIQNASTYQILCKSVYILWSYDVSYIFKMASVRHFEFRFLAITLASINILCTKFGTTWCKISSPRPPIGQNQIFENPRWRTLLYQIWYRDGKTAA